MPGHGRGRMHFHGAIQVPSGARPVVIEHRPIDTAYVVSPPVGGVDQGAIDPIRRLQSIKSIYVVDTAGHTILLIPYPLTTVSSADNVRGFVNKVVRWEVF